MSPLQVAASPTSCFETEVVAVRAVSPAVRRITFGGPDLAHFDDGGPLGPRDLRIKVVAPVDGCPPARVDTEGDGWYPRWLRLDPRHRGELRTYTVRAARTADPAPEVDVDFVLHEHHGRPGPASAWAAAADVGDRMLLLGPNRHSPAPYGGIAWAPPEPGAGRLRVLLAGDETAVPAVASILETLPAGYVGHACLEVAHASEFVPLTTSSEVEVTWLARGGRPRGTLLRRAVRDVVPAAHGSTSYAWVAGEAAVVTGLRRYLVGEGGLPRSHVSFMGYWREGRVSR